MQFPKIQLANRSFTDFVSKNVDFRKVAYGVMIILAILVIMVPMLNHYFFRTYAFDYGAYNFALHDYAHLSVSNNPVYWYNDTTFLQDHLSFTLFFLTPFYWLLKWVFGTYTLLFIQSMFILWGAWSTYKLVSQKSESTALGVLALILYATIYGRYSAFAGDCNLMIILSSFVPVFLYYFHKGKVVISILCFLFLILGRESIPLWTFFISIYMMLEYKKDSKKFRLSTIFMITSLVYFIFAFKVLIPAIENPARPFDLFQYSQLGATPLESLKFMFAHPIDCIKLLFVNHSGDPTYDGVKMEFYWVYIISGGFLLFIRPKYLIPFIPIVAQKMFNDDPVRWGISSYYGVEFASLMPLLAFLALDSYKRIKWSLVIGSLACIGSISMCIYKLEPENRALTWSSDKKTNFLKAQFYKSDLSVGQIHKLLDDIPDDANVSATGTLVPHLAYREIITYFPRVNAKADYIVLLNQGDHFSLTQEDFLAQREELLNDDNWKVIHNDGVLTILASKYYLKHHKK
jgi:uncharacterized membrane protein